VPDHCCVLPLFQYLSGKVAGDMVYETVKLGDVEVKNQVVGLGAYFDDSFGFLLSVMTAVRDI